nr:hypothetical protein BaRGS_013729 [Batillaria attramentaria]
MPVPEDLPAPSARHQAMYRQYTEEMKQGYRQHSHSNNVTEEDISKAIFELKKARQTPQTHPDNNQNNNGEMWSDADDDVVDEQWKKQRYTANQMRKKLDAEELLEYNKKQKLIETVMIDQLSRNGRDAGADLMISTEGQHALSAELARSKLEGMQENTDRPDAPSRLEYENLLFLASVQDAAQAQIRKRGIKTITGLGRHYRQLDKTGTGDLEQVFDIIDPEGERRLDYSVFMRTVLGEMNEFRKALVRKAFIKVDTHKQGTIYVSDIRKFFNVNCPYKPGSVTELYRQHKPLFDAVDFIVIPIISLLNFFVVGTATTVTVVKLTRAMKWRQNTSSTAGDKRQMMLVKMLVTVSCIYITCASPTVALAFARFLVQAGDGNSKDPPTPQIPCRL